MITHSIRAKSLVSQWVDTVMRPLQQQMGWHRQLPPIDNSRYTREHWDKQRFTTWIEETKKTFKADALVTFKAVVYQPGFIPTHWKISYVDELYNFSEFDSVLQEPTALCLQTLDHTFIRKCPKVLRLLTEEEVSLVDLSNKKPAGTC